MGSEKVRSLGLLQWRQTFSKRAKANRSNAEEPVFNPIGCSFENANWLVMVAEMDHSVARVEHKEEGIFNVALLDEVKLHRPCSFRVVHLLPMVVFCHRQSVSGLI